MSTTSPRIFISHSAKTLRAASIKQALFARLESECLCAFLDSETMQGESDWRKRIDDELATCQIGILLVCKDACNSDWVPIEADRLVALLDNGFLYGIIVVSIPSAVREEVLRLESFTPTNLFNRFQAVSLFGEGEAPIYGTDAALDEPTVSSVLDRILAQLKPFLEAHQTDSELQTVEVRLENQLMDADARQMHRALDELGIKVSGSLRPPTLRRLLVRRLLQQEQRERLPYAINELRDVIQKPAEVQEILEGCWLSRGTAKAIAAIARGVHEERIFRLTLPADEDVPLPAMLKRTAAFIPKNLPPRCEFIDFTGGIAPGGEIDEILGFIENHLIMKLRTKRSLNKTLERLDLDERAPVYIAVAPDLYRPELVEAVRQRMPTVTVVLVTYENQVRGAQRDEFAKIQCPMSRETLEGLSGVERLRDIIGNVLGC